MSKLSPDQREKREKAAFRRKIISIFKNVNFEYLKTEGIHRHFGLKKGELDYVFLYKNIILVCEDTTSAAEKEIKRHLKNKKLLTDQIVENKKDLIKWLKEKYPDKFSKFDGYSNSRYKVFHLYFSKSKVVLSDKDRKLYSPINVVEHSSLNYFYKMTQNIKYSARNEIFRYLNIKSKDIGSAASSSSQEKNETTIIYPEDNTGLKNGIRIVSFMMSAEMLISNCYVLRKDNWQDSIDLYQRLIEKNRIKSIRKYLAKRQTAFLNNIIVSLPENISFRNEKDEEIKLEEIHEFKNCKMLIPNEINSICVIDGQHRIFAHYEGEDNDEKIISSLRKKLHLLVTGLVFPPEMGELERRKEESQIFLDINSNAKPVPPDVLLHIETLKDPFSDLGIARQVLQNLNKRNIFLDYFQLSLMEKSKIKIASIIKFALKYLVEISEDKSKATLYNYWRNAKKGDLLLKKDEELLNEYISFVAECLDVYFSAIKVTYKSDWYNDESKILSITSVNGFIMAFRRSLKFYGVKDLNFYKECIEKLDVDFSRDEFPYRSSQYNRFSKQISEQCFELTEDHEGNWKKQTEK